MKNKGLALVIVEIEEFPKIVQDHGFYPVKHLTETIKERLSLVEIKNKSVFMIKDNIFAVLLSDLQSKTKIDIIAQTLQKSLQFTLSFSDSNYSPLYSMGIAYCEQPNMSSTAILSTAFSALEEIKAAGYNRYYLKTC
ncbi:MAG: Diguanylate cyclase, domain [Gammaproteobacteria bacterium]|jgi:GGDEF domain-containing protein|nr:Diguanylate cyclase, domain [Gammaproteobacteria bacterium]